MQLGQQRVHSHASASCSSRWSGANVPDTIVMLPMVARCSKAQHTINRRSTQLQAKLQSAEEPAESPFKIKPGFFEIEDLYDREPNYDDPNWAEDVDNWYEFWNYTRFDLESEQQTDDFDTAGKSTRTSEHAAQLWGEIHDVGRYPAAMEVVTRESQRNHSDVWTEPPMEPEKQEELPNWGASEWRAFAEKQKYKQLLDMEWWRRQSKIGKLSYEHITYRERDVRMRRFEPENWEWSDEDVYKLITQDGAACRPEDHKGLVENPLATVDFSNTMGVTHIVETEEFLEQIGHLGEAPHMELLEEQIIIDLINDDVSPEATLALLSPTIETLDNMDEAEALKEELDNWVPAN